MKISKLISTAIIVSVISLASCIKANYNDDFTKAPAPPIGGFKASDEVATANLVAKWSFDGNLIELKQNLAGTANGTTFTTGIKGQALQGAPNGYVQYNSAGTVLPGLTEFTVSFWMKTAQITAGATSLFQLVNSGDFWPNLYIGFEPTTDNYMRFKVIFQKSGATFSTQFIENQLPNANNDILGKWTNVIVTYDATNSKYMVYLNSAKIFESNPQAGPSGPGLGALKFVNVSRILFGTWNEKVEGRAQPWMANYEGALDEFRIFNKPLSGLEISALYQLEKQGR